MCNHENVVRIQGGYFCPDCKRMFDQIPEKPKAEKPKTEKPKSTKKKAE